MTQTQKDRDALREWAVFYESGLRRQNSDVNLTQAQIAKDRARLEADQTRGMVRSIVMGTGTGEKYDGDVYRHVPCAYEKEVQRDDGFRHTGQCCPVARSL